MNVFLQTLRPFFSSPKVGAAAGMWMSWVELERFVEDAERNPELRESLRDCQTQPQLVLMARQLGYHITRVDLARAWQEHQARANRQASGS